MSERSEMWSEDAGESPKYKQVGCGMSGLDRQNLCTLNTGEINAENAALLSGTWRGHSHCNM